MINNNIIEKIISAERIEPYMKYHKFDESKAIAHYKSNILISESFYPLLAILEIATKAKYNAGFRVIRKFVHRSYFSGTSTIPSPANPHYT